MNTKFRAGRVGLILCLSTALVASEAFAQRRGRDGGSDQGGSFRGGSGATQQFRGSPAPRQQFQSGGSSQARSFSRQSTQSFGGQSTQSFGGQSMQSTRSRSYTPPSRAQTGGSSFRFSPRSIDNQGSSLSTGGSASQQQFSRSYRPGSRSAFTQQTRPGTTQSGISGAVGGASQLTQSPIVVPHTGPSRVTTRDRSNWRPNSGSGSSNDANANQNVPTQNDLNRFFSDRSNRRRATGDQPSGTTSPGTGATMSENSFNRTFDSLRRRSAAGGQTTDTASGANQQPVDGIIDRSNVDRNRQRLRDAVRANTATDNAGIEGLTRDRSQFRPNGRSPFNQELMHATERRKIAEHRHSAAEHVRHDWTERRLHWKHDHDVPFRDEWWRHHRLDHHRRSAFHVYLNRHHHHHPYYWWRPCTVPVVSSWFTFGWPRVYYWNYGPGEYIYCANNVIYVNGNWFAPAPVYYRHTVLLAQSAPELTPEQAAQTQWLPLGVFAVMPEGGAEANLLVQIAVTADGILGGTVFNQATGRNYPIEGRVDQQTQRAAWTFVDEQNQRITMETGVFNFTRPEGTILTHFGPDRMEVWQMVRLEQPANGGQQAPAAVNGEVPALPAPEAKVAD